MPKNLEQEAARNLEAVYTSVAKLTFPQLLIAQASLSEHIHLAYQHAHLTAEREKQNAK